MNGKHILERGGLVPRNHIVSGLCHIVGNDPCTVLHSSCVNSISCVNS